MTPNTPQLNNSNHNLSLLTPSSIEKAGNDEVDIISLLNVLLENKKIIGTTLIAALLGALVSFAMLKS